MKHQQFTKVISCVMYSLQVPEILSKKPVSGVSDIKFTSYLNLEKNSWRRKE